MISPDIIQNVRDGLCRNAEQFALYLFPHARRDGQNVSVGDWSGAPGQSLKVCIAGEKAGLVRDFADSEKGCDLIAATQRVKGCDFITALRIGSDWLGLPWQGESIAGNYIARPAMAKPVFPSVPPLELPLPAWNIAMQCCRRLAEREKPASVKLRDSVAKALGIGSETIREMALDCALGALCKKDAAEFAEAMKGHELQEKAEKLLTIHDERLIYVYHNWRGFHGIKIRNPYGKDSTARFLFIGSAGYPWRIAAADKAEHVLLFEGESDCIAAVDAGQEPRPDTLTRPTRACIASPGIAFKEIWRPLFTGKRVDICFDNDPAGQKATQRVAGILHGHAAQVRILNTERRAA